MLFTLLSLPFTGNQIFANEVSAITITDEFHLGAGVIGAVYTHLDAANATIVMNAEMLERSLSSPQKEKNILKELSVPNNAYGCKSYNFTYMDWHKVTCQSSSQYWILNSDNAWTDTATGIRMVNDRICIAIGQGYGYIPGDLIDVYLTSGDVIECIIGDMKANVDCDDTGRYQATDGSVVEIIVDTNYFSSTEQYPKALCGTVEKLVLVEENP